MEIKKEQDEREQKKEELRCNKGYPSNVNLTLGMGLSPPCMLTNQILTSFSRASMQRKRLIVFGLR